MVMSFPGMRSALCPRKPWLCAGLAAIGLIGVTLMPVTAFAGDPAVVTLSNELKFQPATLHVKAGATVEWRNNSALVHTATADPELAAKSADVALPAGANPFNSGNLKPKATFKHTFAVPGTYKYFCIPHEAAGMVAKIIVSK